MIQAKTLQGLKTKIGNDTHIIVADEPILLGGTNQGLSPFELLEASLASCSSITMRMYADRKQWELQEIDVRTSLIYGMDKQLLFIKKEIFLNGNLSEDQRQRLFTISSKCPVHKVLEKSIEIQSILK